MVRKALYLSLFVVMAILLLTGCPPSLKKIVISNFTVPAMVNENGGFTVSAKAENAETVKFTFNGTSKNGVASAGVYSTTFTAPEVTADATYTVKVEATNAAGAADPQTKSILVKNVPNAPVIEAFNAPATVVPGGTVMLTATITDADDDIAMVKFVVDGVENDPTDQIGDVYEYSFSAPMLPTTLSVSVMATDTTDLSDESIAETVVVELAGGAPPVIEKFDIVGNDFIVLPCGLSANFYVVFEAKAMDPEGDLQEFVATITNPEGEIVETIDLIEPAEEFVEAEGGLYTIFYEDLMNAADIIVGGKYTIDVTASDADSQTNANPEYFWVHAEPAEFISSQFLGGVAPFDGYYIFTEGMVTLELSMFLDSRVTVRVYAIHAENEWDCYCEPMERLFEKDYQEDELMVVTDTVSIDVSDLDPDELWKLVIVAYNPECGEIPCAVCAINDVIEIEPFKLDKAPNITCWAYGTPCYPCCQGYRLFATISDLLLEGEEFFDVFLDVNGTDIPGIEIIPNGDETYEARVEILDGMVEPILEGPTPFTWTVITASGTQVTCGGETIIDFTPPEIEIAIDPCISEEDMGVLWEATYTVALMDNFELAGANISLETYGEPAWLYVDPPETLPGDFDLDGKEDGFSGWIEFDSTHEYEGPMMLTVEASDAYCIQGVEHKEFVVDTYAPRIDFGLLCPDYCDFQCDDTFTYLHWIVEDMYFNRVEISVSGNTNLGEYDGTLSEGQVRWNFQNLDCEDIYITLTAYDNCENSDSVTLEFHVDNVAPVIDVLDIVEPVDPCNDTMTQLQWCVIDNCFDHVKFTISHGYVPESINVWQVGPYTYESDLSSHTADWIFGDVNCASLIVDFWVYDECGNVTYEQHVTDAIVNNTAPMGGIQIFDKEHYEEPECNATCVSIFWDVDPEIDCLEYAYIETNYPSVPCGNVMSESEGVYTYDINWTYSSGWIDFCLPVIDCDTFVATLVIGDKCLREVKFEDYVQIDNSAPLVSIDWLYGEPTCSATYAEFMVTFIDGANEYPCVGEPDVYPGSWDFDTGSFTSQPMGDKIKWTAYGTWYFEEVECVTLEAYLTMGDHCCLICDYRQASEPLCDCCNFVTASLMGTHYIDNVNPEVYEFYTFDPDIEIEGFDGCGLLGTNLHWEVQDGCEIDRVVIEFSHRNGPLTETFYPLPSEINNYIETIYWDFGDVDGEIVWASITVYDVCGNSDYDYIESYGPVDNYCPRLETSGFDSATEKLIIWYQEDIVIPEDAYANIYVWLGCGDCEEQNPCELPFTHDDWALLAVIPAFDASGTYIHEYLETPDHHNDLVVDIHAFRPDYDISAGSWYGFEIFGIHDLCENLCQDPHYDCCTARDFAPMF